MTILQEFYCNNSARNSSVSGSQRARPAAICGWEDEFLTKTAQNNSKNIYLAYKPKIEKFMLYCKTFYRDKAKPSRRGCVKKKFLPSRTIQIKSVLVICEGKAKLFCIQSSIDKIVWHEVRWHMTIINLHEVINQQNDNLICCECLLQNKLLTYFPLFLNVYRYLMMDWSLQKGRRQH